MTDKFEHHSKGTLVLNDGTEYPASFYMVGVVIDGKSGDLMRLYVQVNQKEVRHDRLYRVPLRSKQKVLKFFDKSEEEVYPMAGKNLDGPEPCDLKILESDD